MPRNRRREHSMALYEAILELRDLDQCRKFFEDLCAATELETMEQRFDVAELLLDDEVYTEIAKKTSASSATISRVNRMLNFGTGCLPELIRERKKRAAAQAGENQAASAEAAGGKKAAAAPAEEKAAEEPAGEKTEAAPASGRPDEKK